MFELSSYKPNQGLQLEISSSCEEQPRFHLDAELLYVLEGALRIYQGEHLVALPREGITIVNPNVSYRMEQEGDVLWLRLCIPTQMVADLTQNTRPFFWCDSTRVENQRYDAVRELLRRLMAKRLSMRAQNADFGYLSLCYQLLDELTSNFMPRLADRERQEEMDQFEDRLDRINQYINQNYASPISSQELAEKLYLSQGYLSRFFKKHFGMSFAEHLARVRLYHAVEDLIYTNNPVTSIAYDNGFSNVKALNKVFRERYGDTPTAMRKKLRQVRSEQRTDDGTEKRVENYLRTNGREQRPVVSHTVEQADCSVARYMPLLDSWQDLLNIGTAAELLRSDVREHVLELHRLINMRYVRFWNLFSPEMLLDPRRESGNNFSNLDSILDFLVEHGLRPHIELGMKPKRLLRNVQHPVFEESAYGELNPEVMERFMDALMRHLLRRYSRSELNTWRIEMWQLEDTYGNDQKYEAYFRVFNVVNRCVKRYADGMKVGGCGLRADYLDIRDSGTNFLKRWREQPCQPDFLSAGLYAYEQGEVRQDRYSKRSTDNENMRHYLQKLRDVMAEAGMDHIPLYITEWNLTVSDRNFLNDTCFKGAYIVKNLLDTYGMAQCMGYFQGSDLVMEHYDSDGPFFGGRGLLSRDGVLKPALYAMRFMKWLYGSYVNRGEHYLVTTDGHNCFGIICHNQKVLNYNYYLAPEDKVERERIWNYFEDRNPLQLKLRLTDVPEGTYQVKIYRIHNEAGAPLRAWEEMGYETELTRNDVKYLRRICSPRLTIHTAQTESNTLPLELTLESNEICFVRIRNVG